MTERERWIIRAADEYRRTVLTAPGWGVQHVDARDWLLLAAIQPDDYTRDKLEARRNLEAQLRG